MFHNSWFGEDNQVDDIDPGKDIFALLFLSFFLINAVVLFCVSEQTDEKVSVNTSGKGQGKSIEKSYLAAIKKQGNQLCIVQNKGVYCLPDDMNLFIEKALFETKTDQNGNQIKMITINDPGKSISAGSLLSIIQMLNNVEIGVDFRPISER